MNTQALSLRLQSLSDAHKQTAQLIGRLSKLPASPGSSPLTSDAADARQELSVEIHQSLKEQDEDLELLRQEIEDQTNTVHWTSAARRRDAEKERDRTGLAQQVARLGEDLKIARIQFRKAQLQAKRNAEAAKRKERELLFANVQEGNNTAGSGRKRGQKELSQDELILNASSDVTAALRRTHDLMQQELSRSQFAHDTLQQSTAALSTLTESYGNLDTLLSSSRSLVSTLIHSNKSDTWYLETAFYILLTTIGWLIFRRIIYGPGWWLLYLPTKLLWRLTSVVLNVVIAFFGATGAAKQSAALSNASAQISTSLIVQPSATSGGIPTFDATMAAPSIGSGGRGNAQPVPQASQGEGKSLSEEVGKVAEASQMAEKAKVESAQPVEPAPQGTVLRERRADELPNPKKRIWEEPQPQQQQQEGEKQRDEL